MTASDWVRIGTFVGNAVLFYASFRNQRWAKTQARIEDEAARTQRAAATATREAGDAMSQQEFDRLAANLALRPYFDHSAYRLLCMGFAITAVASLLDLWESGTVANVVKVFAGR